MSKVTVQEGQASGKLAAILDEIGKRFEDVRRRAHQFFERRQQQGSALEDWARAEREILGAPPAKLTETKDAYQIEVALPGFEASNTTVTVAPDEIVVYASREEEHRGEDTNILWTEFGSQEVYRRLPTPAGIDTAKTTATLERGILRIIAPKGALKDAPVAKAAATR